MGIMGGIELIVIICCMKKTADKLFGEDYQWSVVELAQLK